MKKKTVDNQINYIKDGLLIIRNFLSLEEVERFRNILDVYFLNNSTLRLGTRGKALSGFAGKTPRLGILDNFHLNNEINRILTSYIFKCTEFIFAEHSDLHQNKTTDWHRDTLDFLSKDRGNGCSKDLWSAHFHVVKVCFLLQNHDSNCHGMSFKLGTHLSEEIDAPSFYANTKSTDMIIFDQRILHSGQTSEKSYFDQFGKNRYLITYAYGLDNKLTRTHIKGASLRQKRQQLSYS